MTVVPSDFNRNKDNRIRRRGLRRAGNDFPDGPVAGDIFYEIDANILWLYDGTNWTDIGGSGSTSTTPPGVINAYWGNSAPVGWLICDGAAIPAEHVDLIALIGANTPNLKGRVLVGQDASQVEFEFVSQTGGTKTVTLTPAQMPIHDHFVDIGHGEFSAPDWQLDGTPDGGGDRDFKVYDTRISGPAGDGEAHDNLQPYTTLSYIIKT